ncbi:RTA1-like protein [Lyophyllum atratum]|nr:RTA1-like protein [Lyophyllum atratum]
MSSNNGTSLPQGATHSPYNYVPTRWVAIVFVVLFGISTLLHIGQAIRFRMWWLFPTICICGAAEAAGWGGRLWSSYNPSNGDAFMLQICTTILAPTPLVAANFIILGRIIRALGASYSRIPPRWYAIIFCVCDIIALAIQGAGGGIASSANTHAGSGANIMLAGIIFQTVMITLYAGLAIEYFIRRFYNKPFPAKQGIVASSVIGKPSMGSNLKIMTTALMFSTLFLFIRAIYRTIELADGWNGRVISTEVYFNVLDGAMVILAIYTMNIAHPGVFLPSKDEMDSTKTSNDSLAMKERGGV